MNVMYTTLWIAGGIIAAVAVAFVVFNRCAHRHKVVIAREGRIFVRCLDCMHESEGIDAPSTLKRSK